MNRDAVLATLIGFAIGITITGVFLLGPNLKNVLPDLKLPTINFSSQLKKTSEQNPIPTPVISGVSIDSPASETIVDSDTLLVSGSAPPQTTVVIQGDLDDNVSIVGDDGKYASKVTLKEGGNDISVTGYTKDNQPTIQSIIVYYTTEEF